MKGSDLLVRLQEDCQTVDIKSFTFTSRVHSLQCIWEIHRFRLYNFKSSSYSSICRFYNGLISEATYNNILNDCSFTFLGPYLSKQDITIGQYSPFKFSSSRFRFMHMSDISFHSSLGRGSSVRL